MRVSLVLRSFEAAKARIPSIRFRGGAQGQLNQGRSGGGQSASSKGGSSGGDRIYEEFQLPARFKRQVIDAREIDAINSGGAY